ncbi:arsenite efflux transporter metallochaperone ArsD [Proteiniclasticum sp. SCR006]|uniref:Arsenite efflux transporter metallochaperone ArsD n=1 Tax=Proteiniclasticum aestuarii TaxID=2817862 RepID=A0A939HCR5_9CLOT|nr:arsenite efflux transporter metallochaperone ArsD [Proteiniclasticum aestuarii]MBO1264908.1 arsenite efflux transporter metallochaperone ArsD [Proteiniclasticum aestuarii]
MKKMAIYEPAMCCSTGVCGVGVDEDLLRISTVLSTLKKNDVVVERYNLSSSPQAFITNPVVNGHIREKGLDVFPITLVDDEIVLSGRYPSNEEFITLLDLSENII